MDLRPIREADVRVCPLCAALVLKEGANAHRDWHLTEPRFRPARTEGDDA